MVIPKPLLSRNQAACQNRMVLTSTWPWMCRLMAALQVPEGWAVKVALLKMYQLAVVTQTPIRHAPLWLKSLPLEPLREQRALPPIWLKPQSDNGIIMCQKCVEFVILVRWVFILAACEYWLQFYLIYIILYIVLFVFVQ